MDAFSALYGKLDPRQREAVDAIDGPVMVVAGPGTGKTTILALRIANILKRTDTPAHGILAITYTDAGVKAMRAKLREIIGGRAHEVALHTFHGFASAMIAEYPDHFLRLEGFRNMTDIEQESLVRDIIADPAFGPLRPTGKPDAYLSAVMEAIEDAKKEALTPDMVRKYAENEMERVKNDKNSISTRGASKGRLKAEAEERIVKCERTVLFAGVYDRYESIKRDEKRTDFSDLIIELLKAMEGDELFLRLIQERFLHVLVDEHQDTNDAQNLVVKAIAQFFDRPNVFIVGDEKQAIYRFQGASVENFFSLRKRWPGMKVVSLDTNYRSHQGILDASFSVIENNYQGDEHGDLRVRLKSGLNDEPKPVNVVTGENTAAMERYLINELRSVSAGNPSATAAIITRRNRELERVIRLLESNGIAVSSERSVDIFHHPIGSVFFELLEYLSNPAKTDALAKTLAAGMWGLDFDTAAGVIRSLRAGKAADADKRMPGLLHLQRKMLNDAPVPFIVSAAEESGFAVMAAGDPSFIHVWRGIVTLAESLTRDGNIVSPAELVKSMLAYRQSAELKTVKVSVGAPDLPFRAMTAHGSKGLEFDYVFIPYATEESWIGRPRGSSFVLPKKSVADGGVPDMRRLFYVALTRARKHCAVLTALEESDGKALTPLRFIGELDAASAAQVSLPREDVGLPAAGSRRAGGGTVIGARSDKMTDLAKHILLKDGLSVTALNHFLKCPNEFLYLSVLKLPRAPSAAAEKGTAMHEAVSRVWKLKRKTVEDIRSALAEGIDDSLGESFLAAGDKEAVKMELAEAVPAVAEALWPHFNMRGAISTERWAEGVFYGSYEGRKIALPVHGKLDAVVETADAVEVFDYKTRQAMSIQAVKGETKDSSGDYWRQLIFYKLLLSDDHRWRTKQVNPSLVFVSPDKKGRCPVMSLPVTGQDTAALKGYIQLLVDSVWSGSAVSSSCGERDCQWCALRRLSAGYC